ncbi:MAG: 50S ribosomal protein L11 methyltransferase [Lachnospiraceae bacterium]|nr:50S ribosomal protein L11 methyltransferase [Lachnospiraceae bacterium]
MKWIKLSLSTTVEAEDLITAILDEMGIEGVQIEDKVQLSEEDKKKMFIDILPELPPDDGEAVLSFYVDCDTDIEELKSCIIENVSGYSDEYNVGTLEFTVSETEDTDWINNWKQYFKPFRADEGIVIKPTWTDVSELPDHTPDDLIIEIDPGTAFGTGAHETTKLCIKALKKYIKYGDKLLDVGCGSGILSIVGMKLGAECALGVDVDENASRTSVENTMINGIGASYDNGDGSVCHVLGENEDTSNSNRIEIKNNHIIFFTGNVLEDDKLCKRTGFERFDVVVANILADIIIPLSGITAKYMRKGAIFISSGIINTKEEAVREALLKNGFKIIEVLKMNDWVAFVAQK